MPAPAVVDAVEQVDIALYTPQLLFRLALRVNKLSLVPVSEAIRSLVFCAAIKWSF